MLHKSSKVGRKPGKSNFTAPFCQTSPALSSVYPCSAFSLASRWWVVSWLFTLLKNLRSSPACPRLWGPTGVLAAPTPAAPTPRAVLSEGARRPSLPTARRNCSLLVQTNVLIAITLIAKGRIFFFLACFVHRPRFNTNLHLTVPCETWLFWAVFILRRLILMCTHCYIW